MSSKNRGGGLYEKVFLKIYKKNYMKHLGGSYALLVLR
jgi:hypothetical protein